VADNHKTMVIASSYPMPQESQLDGKVEGTGLMRDEKSLEELDQVLGIVHGVPFTEKKSAVLLMHWFFESFASLFCERN
jgi:hypothetical protein